MRERKLFAFKQRVWNYYRKHGRRLPWRRTRNPYRIFVSEIMLQQTQVERVIPKYNSFVRKFGSFEVLARAPLKNILREWQGLGYNRRALHMKRAAEIVMREHGGKLPSLYSELVKLPGVGPYTARALRTFVWDEPEAFIETNIRTVFIHHFFPRRTNVTDTEIIRYIVRTLDQRNSREWHYALMDYGAYLKRTFGNSSTQSAHYVKQKPFRGSLREARGTILRILAKQSRSVEQIAYESRLSQDILRQALRALKRDGLITTRGRRVFVAPR